jgi:hypothetical protein
MRTGLLALLAVDVLQGWEEGKGLGKDKQGIKSHIRVRKPREEKSGWLFIMLEFSPAPNFSVKSADSALQQYASQKSLWMPTPPSRGISLSPGTLSRLNSEFKDSQRNFLCKKPNQNPCPLFFSLTIKIVSDVKF